MGTYEYWYCNFCTIEPLYNDVSYQKSDIAIAKVLVDFGKSRTLASIGTESTVPIAETIP